MLVRAKLFVVFLFLRGVKWWDDEVVVQCWRATVIVVDFFVAVVVWFEWCWTNWWLFGSVCEWSSCFLMGRSGDENISPKFSGFLCGLMLLVQDLLKLDSSSNYFSIFLNKGKWSILPVRFPSDLRRRLGDLQIPK